MMSGIGPSNPPAKLISAALASIVQSFVDLRMGCELSFSRHRRRNHTGVLVRRCGAHMELISSNAVQWIETARSTPSELRGPPLGAPKSLYFAISVFLSISKPISVEPYV